MHVFNADIVYAASDLVLHCLSVTLVCVRAGGWGVGVEGRGFKTKE